MDAQKMEQVIVFEDLGFPIQTSFGKILTPEDPSLTQPMRHKELELKLFLDGTAIVDVGTSSFLCREGDILLINPYETHSIRCLDEDAKYHLLMVDPAFLLGRGDEQDFRYLKPFLEGRIVFSNLIRSDSVLHSTVFTLFRELEAKEEAYELAVKGMLYRLISLLLRSQVKSIMTRDELHAREKYGHLLAPAISYISANLSEAHNLDHLATLCSVSPKYFCRIFRKLTGMTCTAYIMERRIARAELLILSTCRPISEIADEVGFPDPCYFSRCFRRLRGISPSSVR